MIFPNFECAAHPSLPGEQAMGRGGGRGVDKAAVRLVTGDCGGVTDQAARVARNSEKSTPGAKRRSLARRTTHRHTHRVACSFISLGLGGH